MNNNNNNSCDCATCKTMKNPAIVHEEPRVVEGFDCLFAIYRDGKTQTYRAVLEVEAAPGRVLGRNAEFKMRKGVSQEQAIKAIILATVEADVLDELLAEAHEVAGTDDGSDFVVEAIKADLDRMFQQAAQDGVSAGDALRQRLAEMRRDADRELAAQDPFRPVKPKVKQYLN